MATQTQTTTGGATPSYTLDSNILAAVAKAGPSGSKARGILDESSTKGANLKGAADAIAKGGAEVRKQVQAKRNAKIKAAEDFDAGWDRMSESGSWANEDLFSKFEAEEKTNRAAYITAVKNGDKGEMAKLMKAQASRSNSLQQWRGTMETAQKIQNGVGWSKAFMSDDPEAVEKRELLTALAKMEGGEGGMANNMVFEDGQMVFKVGDKTYTRRQIDDLVAEGTKPINLELGYMQELANMEKAGAEGQPFNRDRALNTARLSIKNENINALMTEDFGGGGSFSEHIMSHPDFAQVFTDMGLTYTTTVKSTDGTKNVSPTSPDSPGGATITPEEMKNFNEADMNMIIGEMKKDPDTAREYLAEYKTLQLENAHMLGSGDTKSEFVARRKTVNSMTEAELTDFKKNPPPEFRRADGSLDLYKFLGFTE